MEVDSMIFIIDFVILLGNVHLFIFMMQVMKHIIMVTFQICSKLVELIDTCFVEKRFS